jgi:hypothetical protein
VPAWPPPITMTSKSLAKRISLNPQEICQGRVL